MELLSPLPMIPYNPTMSENGCVMTTFNRSTINSLVTVNTRNMEAYQLLAVG